MASINGENEDEIFARIQEESLRYYNEVELPRLAAEALRDKQHSEAKIDDVQTPQPESSKTNISVVSQGTPVKELFYQSASQGAGGFHLATGDTYIYPTNYPVRKYQRNIIQSALFHNTLVSLPTGLGKTFIAAVVMFNYYRWFPQAKVVFVAPTRPLVAQQIRACHDIMAIPIKDTVEMTGTMNPIERTQQWKNKRVFFLTPQVMANDLRSGICPAKTFKCVVIDEAHKATGEYAYCHVIKELENANAVFRVLALSATPGSNIRAVIEVVQNLRITTLELRGDDSPDVLPYTHAKQVEPTILNLSKNIIDFREQFLLIFERYARSLRQVRLITCNVQNMSKFQLLKVGERLRSRPPNGMHKTKVGQMMADLMVCMSLAHGLELLQTYGLRAFYHYFTGCEDEENRKAAFTRLRQDIEFHQLMEVLNKAISSPMNVYWSHPKHETLVKILLEHFSQDGENSSDSKVIIFCQYRVVVSEIHELLMNIHPKIKPAMFIGQGVGKDKNGLPQKKQIEIMKQFREGRSNVLIATCVAEEGLDIGSVDLLVLMEVQRSPVRLIQRLGRTGRHRKGRCVVLLTKGKEVQKFHEAMATRKSFLDTIKNSRDLAGSLYRNEPVMFPPNLMPKMQLMHINVPERITPGKSKKQSDIRQALIAKLSDTEEVVEESPFLSDEQAALVQQELDTTKLDFNTLSFTNSEYLFNKIDDAPMRADKLFSGEFCKQSEFNEWNREPHQTYLLSHSSDTETLCHLLSRAEALQTGDHADINSQIGYSQLMKNPKKPQKAKAKTNVEVESKKKKTDQGTKAGMDIRECMAAAADKARLTQHLKKDEMAMSEPIVLDTIIDLDISIDQPCPDIVVENADESIKESSDKRLDVNNSLSCSLCCELVKRVSTLSGKLPEIEEEEPFTLLELNAVNNLVENLTKDIIENINVSEMFGGPLEYSMKNLKNSIAVMEENVNLMSSSNENVNAKKSGSKAATMHCNPTKEQISPKISYKVSEQSAQEKETRLEHPPRESTPDVFDVNNIFEEEPPFKMSTPKICTETQSKNNADTKKNEYSPGFEDFFGIEDLFNEEGDIATFGNLNRNTKTSTPISKIEKSSVTNNILDMKTNSSFSGNSTLSMGSTNKTDVKRNIFKIPQLKFSFETVKTPVLARVPKSPINLSSPESPILSGQVTQASRQISPPKLERKVLFQEDSVKEYKDSSISDISFFCKPLNKTDTLKNDDVAKCDLNISVSQLFDDDDDDFCNLKNESKNSVMDQSSMYTITQMVNKVSAINKNQSSKSKVSTKNNSDKAGLNNRSNIQNQNVSFHVEVKKTIDFGSSDEDSIFNNIDLDALEPSKQDVQKQPILPNARNQKILENTDDIIEKSKPLQTEIKEQVENYRTEVVKNSVQAYNSTLKTEANTSTGSELGNSTVTSRWASFMKSPLNMSCLKTSTPSSATQLKTATPNAGTSFVHSDSDSNSSVFLSPARNKSVTSGKPEKIMKKKQKAKAFVELEADVSGAPVSSDEENTSGLDELDASFINDMTQQVNTSVNQTATDIQARYLQSVKSPIRKPGGFKIPTMSDTVLGMDVFSQAVEEDDNDSYENDSFCCDDTEIPVIQDPSILEIAEQRLKKKKRKRKTVRKRKVVQKSDSSSDEMSNQNREKYQRRLLTSESSCENNSTDESVNRKRKRRKLLSSESSLEDKSAKIKNKDQNKPYLLTSESDSDVTDLELNC